MHVVPVLDLVIRLGFSPSRLGRFLRDFIQLVSADRWRNGSEASAIFRVKWFCVRRCFVGEMFSIDDLIVLRFSRRRSTFSIEIGSAEEPVLRNVREAAFGSSGRWAYR